MEPKTLQGIGIGDVNEAHKLEIFCLATHLRLDSDSFLGLPDLRGYRELVRPNRRLGFFEPFAAAL